MKTYLYNNTVSETTGKANIQSLVVEDEDGYYTLFQTGDKVEWLWQSGKPAGDWEIVTLNYRSAEIRRLDRKQKNKLVSIREMSGYDCGKENPIEV